MALTITYDGYGVVANADALTNDTGGSGTGDWSELGGGSYSLSPDASKYGVASIGSKYASKSGYTYIDGITPLDYSSGGAQEGELIYIWVMTLSPTPLQLIASTPYNIVIGDSTGTLNEYTVASKSDSNGWDGRWRVFVIDPTITPTINGGANLAAIDTIGVWMDTNVSVRAESFFISQIISAKGLKVEGTSSTFYADIVAWAEDYANRAAGMFQSRGQTYFSLGSLSIHSDTANTVVSADGSNVEYEKCEFWNGTAWVTSYTTTANALTIEATGGNTCDLVDTNIGMSGNSSNRLSMLTTSATSYKRYGGYLKYLSTLISTANDEFNGVVFSLYNARTLGLEPYNGCTFDGGTSLTLTSTSDFANGNTINGKTGISSILTSSLSYLATNIINSSGSNHGVELTSIGSGSMTWNCITSGFDTGSTGSPVTPTSTGNEDIYVNVASGTLTINVSDTATVPSIRSAGATVNVVAGQKTFTFTLSTALTNYEWRLYEITTLGSLAGSVEIAGEENATAGSKSYSYSYSSDQPIAVQIINQPDNDYVESITYYTLGNSDQSVTILLEKDNNN